MRILVLNSGSSTLKFKILILERDTLHGEERTVAQGVVERIGTLGILKFVDEKGRGLEERIGISDHGKATQKVLDWLNLLGYLGNRGIDAVGFRVVHGGPHFLEPTLIDDQVLEALERISHLALLHNHPSIQSIRMVKRILGVKTPLVAVFDTAFHSEMPERACRYPIPFDLTEKHYLFRYGFHGIAHQYMFERYIHLTSTPREKTKMITLQLGSGCSAAAIEKGRSIDTSMGLTPLEGLMMGTRSGDVDPHLPNLLAQREGITLSEVETILNRKSGLLGVSGYSQDVRELLERESQGDENSTLALEMFCYRVKKQIGAYFAALGGAEVLIFGGGIGENSPVIRNRICAGMEWCGMRLDENQNRKTIGKEGKIHEEGSKVAIYVIPVDEASIIGRETLKFLQNLAICTNPTNEGS